MARLLEHYRAAVVPEMMKRFSYTTPMAVPRMVKVVVNMGVGKALENDKRLSAAAEELTQITGQRAVTTKAKISVSGFRLREGQAIGCRVTLRGLRMYEFVDRLFNIAIPRIRDFRGCSPRAFDGRGNYNLGLTEQTVFPEIAADRVEFSQGMDIAFVTTAKSDEEARALLERLGLRFRK
jgi:large subunit ribosomal protein L5